MPLSPYRVVELSNERTAFCGHILQRLGAEVIVVEPPGGSELRQTGPFLEDEPGPERSLTWWAYNGGKRSVVLDPAEPAGRQQLAELLQGTDILIEGLAPGALATLGLSDAVLEDRSPGLITASITTFGQSGPKAAWLGGDLVAMAASTTQWIWGDLDRPPVRMAAAAQAFHHAGAEAAIGALIALQERARSGRGQRIDVSAQAAMTFSSQSHSVAGGWGATGLGRFGGGLKFGPLGIRFNYPCRDGHVSTGMFFGPLGHPSNRLTRLVHDLGYVGDWILEKDLVSFLADFVEGKESAEDFNRMQEAIAAYCADHTKAELYAMAREHDLLQAPNNTGLDLLSDAQLNDRGYWEGVAHDELGTSFRFPGAFARFSATPLKSPERAPLLGEQERAIERREAPADLPGATDGEAEQLPLEGLKVLDLTWALVGPAAVRNLSDHGATVVRIESTTRMDPIRAGPPFKDDQPGPERSAEYANYNAGKLTLTLNLRTEAGREVVRRLVVWADVVAEAFTPGVMARWGLDYAALREINPAIIMISTSLNGQTGPDSELGGYGAQGSARAGFTTLLGWPDRDPALPAAYTDYCASKLVAIAVLAALDHRRRTGEGQYIDVSQVEASIPYIAHAALAATVNGRELQRAGNRHETFTPYGVFPCQGEDRWIAIEVHDDEQFAALSERLGTPEWAGDERFADAASRQTNEDELEALIAEAAATHERDALQDALQAAAVPAHGVVETTEGWREPQLQARGHFVTVETAEVGPAPVEGGRFILSRTPGWPGRVPGYGDHNDLVLREFLGLPDEEIAKIAASGAIE